MQLGQDISVQRQMFERAVALHQAGHLAAAERLYTDILRLSPSQPDAQHLLGVLRGQQGCLQDAAALIAAALKARPDWPGALANYGLVLQRLNRREEALACYDRALTLKPDHAEALNSRGNVLVELGRLEQALASYVSALTLRPNFPDAHNNRGNALAALGCHADALASYDQALALRPDFAQAHNNRGHVLEKLGRHEEALASYDRAVALEADYAEAWSNRGNALAALGRRAEALASFDKALGFNPASAEAFNNRGNVLSELERQPEALVSFDRALAVRPDYAEALHNRGRVLSKLGRHEEALASDDKALALKPDYAAALGNRGNTLLQLRRADEALASFDRALALRPADAAMLNNRGTALKALKRLSEALASYDAALAIAPDFADALYNRANALKELRRFDEALASYERARAVAPDHADAYGLADAVLALCDWPRAAALVPELRAEIGEGKASVTPFMLIGACDDPDLHLRCAENFIHDKVPIRPAPLWNGARFRHDRIRLAYLSADFQAHATAYLMAELFERHDRSRFELLGISFGRDDGGDMRKRLAGAFDEFVDVRVHADREVARLLHGRQVDIAVDLKGYTLDSRPEILSFRPAPIQVNYLGYPGTMGADFIDYVIADAVVLPFDQQPFYAERIVHLPDCYQPNDTQRKIAERIPTRGELGLPERDIVFCCFNNSYKITEPVFSIWMRLLAKISGSVLWLLRDNGGAENNLRREAQARGIDPGRLVFADRCRLDAHLARHRCADLFLDTLPYNAHTTASDALWAGLPLVTCRGRAFAGRVAASLLRAIGLPELATETLADYEALALRLASDPTLLGEIRAKLARGRQSQPLFDTDRFRRHIESAYATMWETWQRGEPPESFSVAGLGDST